MRILLASSSHTDARTALNVLSEAGYEGVTPCYTPETAIERLAEKTWDLLITEKHLTSESGRSLVRRVRARPNGGGLPVLMLANQYTHEDVLAATRSGVNGFLVFPCSADLLRQKIDDLTESSDGETIIYRL